jgi:uncharacterized protein (DUF2147 family)
MRLSLLISGFCCSTCVMAGEALAADPTGLWTTEKGKAMIEISDCGGALCGKIAWLAQPNDPQTGGPATDKKNRDETKRQQPLVGTQIVHGMKPSGQGDRWSGRVYNPEDGGTYAAHMTMKSDDTLRIEGCMMVICSGETWKRAATTGSVSMQKQQPAAGKPASNGQQPADRQPASR